MPYGLELRGIQKTFGDVVALNSVSLGVRLGEFVSILGPSGCGKSTLLRILAGLEPADTGSVHIAGRTVDHMPPKDRGIAFVFQSYALYPHLTTAENIAAPLMMQELTALERLPGVTRLWNQARAKRDSIDERMLATARMLQIEHLLSRRPVQLSGGQRQRVALGRALVREPSAFLLDEPLANLDANLRTHMRSEIASIQKRLGVTTLFVTHDQMEALALSDRIAIMFDGEIRQFAPPDELYRNPVDMDVAAFFSQPRLNSIPASANGGGFLTVAGRRVRIADDADGEGVVAFRPEDAMLVETSREESLPIIVDRVEHAGADAHVFARLLSRGGEVVLRVPSEKIGEIRKNDRYGLLIDLNRAWFFGSGGRRAPGRRQAAA